MTDKATAIVAAASDALGIELTDASEIQDGAYSAYGRRPREQKRRRYVVLTEYRPGGLTYLKAILRSTGASSMHWLPNGDPSTGSETVLDDSELVLYREQIERCVTCNKGYPSTDITDYHRETHVFA